MSLRVTRSVIEDIKEDAKLILSNRKSSEGKPDVCTLAKKHGCSRTAIRNVLNATTNQPVQSSTDAVFSVTDIVATTDAAVPSADAAVVTTEVVTLTDVVTLSAEAVPFFDADAAAIYDLLNKLRGSTVSAVCTAYYALTDTDFCSEMTRLHQLGKSVNVFLMITWTRSCKVGLECVMALMASGIPDSMVAVGGSANMTKLHGRGMTSLYSMSKDQPVSAVDF
ncbi:hypothetical protein JG687_00017174 [Phytophthora cactorum]|uniref:Uncharacterized protein n=1 Tax=Phytophthora cactorum TaxID=29920 RepID=A0A8T1TRZ5_9STRA|nr:hypothetical protein JG687_00017174 [Phytophthora cactorum]